MLRVVSPLIISSYFVSISLMIKNLKKNTDSQEFRVYSKSNNYKSALGLTKIPVFSIIKPIYLLN